MIAPYSRHDGDASMTNKRIFYRFLLGTALLSLCGAGNAGASTMLEPTGQWLVNSAVEQGMTPAGAAQTPCIMANQYNNGFILRVAGGGGKILSVSIDFRQDAFQKGAAYPVTVSVDGHAPQSLQASAFTPNILVIGIAGGDSLYEQLQSGKALTVSLAGQTMSFSLAQSSDGLRRLESCYSPPQMEQGTRVTAIPTTPDTQVYVKRETTAEEGPQFKQPSAQDLLKAPAEAPVSSRSPLDELPPLSETEMADLNLTPEDLAPYDPQVIPPAPAAKPAASPKPAGMTLAAKDRDASYTSTRPQRLADAGAPAPRSDVPRAPAPITRQELAAVEPARVMSDIPQRPSGPPVSIAPRSSSVSQQPLSTPHAPVAAARWQAEAGEDIRDVLSRWAARDERDFVWDADRAGGRLVRDIAMDGSFEEAVAQVMADNAAALGLESRFVEEQPMTGTATTMSARAGDDLRDVVQRWAAQNNVTLDWRADEPFRLPHEVSAQGDFAQALEAALTQFDNRNVRPVGQLNRDPVTGRLSLTIETDRTS